MKNCLGKIVSKCLMQWAGDREAVGECEVIGVREKVWIVFLLLLLLLYGVAICVCFLPLLRKRLGRRGIGAFADEAEWRDAVGQKAKEMLRHMPVLPEEDTPAFCVAMWRSGVDAQRLVRRRLAKLLLAAGLAQDRAPDLFLAGRACAESLLLPDGKWKVPMDRAEDAFLAYAVLSFPGMELGRIRPAMEQTAHLLQSLAGESDTIPADPDAPDLRFARTVSDICPFLAAYAAAYEEPFYLNLAMRQLNEYLLGGMHPVQGLPAEGFDRGSGLPIGSFGWSKACAALAFGMMETARYLPGADFRSVKLRVHSRILADRLCPLWGEDGAFPRLPAASLPDTEAGAILTVFLWDVYQKTENEHYLDCVKRAMANLRNCTRKNGMVDFAQPESLRPGFYWETETPTAGALAAAFYAAVKTEGPGRAAKG